MASKRKKFHLLSDKEKRRRLLSEFNESSDICEEMNIDMTSFTYNSSEIETPEVDSIKYSLCPSSSSSVSNSFQPASTGDHENLSLSSDSFGIEDCEDKPEQLPMCVNNCFHRFSEMLTESLSEWVCSEKKNCIT